MWQKISMMWKYHPNTFYSFLQLRSRTGISLPTLPQPHTPFFVSFFIYILWECHIFMPKITFYKTTSTKRHTQIICIHCCQLYSNLEAADLWMSLKYEVKKKINNMTNSTAHFLIFRCVWQYILTLLQLVLRFTSSYTIIIYCT